MKIRRPLAFRRKPLRFSRSSRHSASVIIASVALVNGEELRPASPLNVVLFSGGRGSAALARQLVSSPGVNLTIVINGYDDGASTGEVRRFLGDSLGPSDFRKNASNLAAALHTCPAELIAFLDLRCPSRYEAAAALSLVASPGSESCRGCIRGCHDDAFPVDCAGAAAAAVAAMLGRFAQEIADTGTPVRLRRLQPRQSRVRRRVPACRTRLQSRGRRLLRARRSAGRPRRERHRRHQRVPRRRRRRRAAAGDRGSDRRRGAAQQHSRDLPRRSATDCERRSRRFRRSRWTLLQALARRQPRLDAQPAGGGEDCDGGPHHLRAGDAALEPVPVLPDARPWRRDRQQSRRDEGARHQHSARRRDHRQQRRRLLERAVYFLRAKGSRREFRRRSSSRTAC